MKHTYFNVDEGATIHLMGCNTLTSRSWIVTSVEVNRKFRGQGAAGRLLKEVVDEADATGATLFLGCVSDHSPGSLTDEDLHAFYSRYGFQDHDIEGSVMVRKPRVR